MCAVARAVAAPGQGGRGRVHGVEGLHSFRVVQAEDVDEQGVVELDLPLVPRRRLAPHRTWDRPGQ